MSILHFWKFKTLSIFLSEEWTPLGNAIISKHFSKYIAKKK